MVNKVNELEQSGFKLYQEKSYLESLKKYLEIVKIYPNYDYENIRFMLGEISYALNDKEKAVDYYLLAHNFDPSNPIILGNLFDTLYEINDRVSAKKYGLKYLDAITDPSKKAVVKQMLESL